MATLGTQNISTSYVQLIKTSGLTGIDATIQTITDGNNVSSALQLSSAGVNSTGTLNAVGATTLASSLAVTGAVTLSSSLGVTGAATLSSSLGVTGVATFSTSISATTGTATIGTLQVGASGSKLTSVSFGTAAFTSATVAAHNGVDTTTGTFTLTGAALGDIVFGSLNSLGSATGTVNIGLSLYPQTTNVVRYSIQNQGATAGTIPAGIFFATAMRFTA